MSEHYPIRSCSWSRTPKRCRAEGIASEFIHIDDDDVIILDFPESSKLKPSNASKNQSESSAQAVISIDDDDEDYDEDGDDTDSDVHDDDCQVIQEKSAAFRFSKCKQTFAKKSYSRNRFGLGSKYEAELSDSDSDCEVLEGSNSKVREQWEKAFVRKKHKAGKASSSSSEEASHSEHHAQAPSFFASRNSDAGKESTSSIPNDNEGFNATSLGSETNKGDHQVNHNADEDHFQGPENSWDEHREGEEEADAESSGSEQQTSDGDGDTFMFGNSDNEARGENEMPSLSKTREPIVDSAPSTSGQIQVDHEMPEADTVLEREKFKETDEYKRAEEEEWECRKKQLQIQAEEAQRQRKKRKLESMRRLEMERRQKERVEEIRETQKKDEESMNMKEKVRAQVSKSLKLLELQCCDMVSLLRGLGIHVDGGTFPTSQDVHAAYKRAALRFHPDRASRGDLQHQVEAEEKFKLIARMKDKFLSTS